MTWLLLLMGGFGGVIRAGLASAATAAVLLTGMHFWGEWVHDPAVRREALAGFVAQAEKDAVQGQLDEMRRQKIASDDALIALEGRSRARAKADAEANQKLEQEIADHEKLDDAAGRTCGLSGADIEWLRK